MKTKICTKCKLKKSINEFSKDRTRKDGLFCWCKECKKNNAKIFYIKNKEKIDRNSRKYYHNNKEHCDQKSKEWRKNNPVKVWCSNTINHHKHRGYEVLFKAKELYEIAKNIKYCPIDNTKLDWSIGGKGCGGKLNSPSLDRKDNGNILTLDNIWIICHRCNITKQDRTIREMITWCKKFLDFFK